MNDKKIPMDKQEELRLRAEPFLSREKTPTANKDEYYILLGDFEEFFNDLKISDEWRPLEKMWNKLRLLDEIYAMVSLYADIDETEIVIEFGDKNNDIECTNTEVIQMNIDDISEDEILKLRAAPFLLGRKSPIANADEYIAVHDDLVEFMPLPGYRGDTSLQKIYSKWRPLEKILDSFHLLDGIYKSMSQLNIDESEVSIRFKNLNNDIEYTWSSDDFKMHIDYVFHYPGNSTIHKELTIVVGQVECGMLCADDTVLINGRSYDISHIIHTGYNPKSMKYYAESGMNIALVLKSDHPCHIIQGSLVTKKEVSE